MWKSPCRDPRFAFPGIFGGGACHDGWWCHGMSCHDGYVMAGVGWVFSQVKGREARPWKFHEKLLATDFPTVLACSSETRFSKIFRDFPWTYTLKVWMLIFFGFSKFDLICWGCPGSNPSSPFEETKSQLQASGESEGWKDERMNDITCHLRTQEPFEWILNIFWLQFCKTHLVVRQWYVLQWLKHWKRTSSQLKDSCLRLWTPGHKALMIKRIIKQFV